MENKAGTICWIVSGLLIIGAVHLIMIENNRPINKIKRSAKKNLMCAKHHVEGAAKDVINSITK